MCARVSSDDRCALCEDEPTPFKFLYVLTHCIAAHPDSIADGGIACVTLISFAVFYVEQITVDGNRSSRQSKLVDTIRQRKIIFRGAYAIIISKEAGFDGVLVFKAKTTELVDYYIREFGACHAGSYDPFRLIIWEDAAETILSEYRKEDI